MDIRYSWLLFDADGTLLDYDAAEPHALRTAVESFGLDITEDIRRDYHRINSGFWAMLEKGEITSAELRVRRFEVLAREYGWTMDAGEFSHRYLAELGRSGHMIPGALEMLKALPADAKKVIITNGIRDTQHGRLNDAGITGMFDAIVISEDAGVAKPAAGFFDHLVERIGFGDTSRMIVIGDSLSSDIAGGNGYGIDTCWFNPAGKENPSDIRPTYEIRDWEGLSGILDLASSSRDEPVPRCSTNTPPSASQAS